MAAEHLTEQDKAELRDACNCSLCAANDTGWHGGDLVEAIERIVARHREEVAEQIALAIEVAAVAADVDMVEIHGAFVRRAPYAAEHLRDAARIALEHKERRPGHGP